MGAIKAGRSWPTGIALFIGASAYVYWARRFFCMAGYMAHPPFATWELLLERVLPVLLFVACWFAVRNRCVARGFSILTSLAMLAYWTVEQICPTGFAAFCVELPGELLCLLALTNLTPLPRFLAARVALDEAIDLLLTIGLEIWMLKETINTLSYLPYRESTQPVLSLAPLALFAVIVIDGTITAWRIFRKWKLSRPQMAGCERDS